MSLLFDQISKKGSWAGLPFLDDMYFSLIFMISWSVC